MRKHGIAVAASLAGSVSVALVAAAPALAQSGTRSYQVNLQPVPLNGAANSGAGGCARAID